MYLIYRGIAYKKNNYAVETTVEKMAGKYRSRAYQICQVKTIVPQQPAVSLKYRGVEYIANDRTIQNSQKYFYQELMEA